MQVVSASVSNGGLVGETIDDQHHGVNLLFHSDDVQAGSDFLEVIDAVGASTIRYPGGTVTEEYFDLANPDAATQINIIDVMHDKDTVRSRDVVGISEFLTFIADTDSDPVICLPTYRYFDAATGAIDPGAETEIKTFIRNLLTDQYGPADAVTIEIGNEYYQSKFNWTDAEFAVLQGQIAEWIHDEATDLGLRGEIDILAQAGKNYAVNAMFASEFSGGDAAQIDGVVSHFYGTNSSGNTLGIGGGIGDRLDDINSVWGATLGPDFLLAVTEWNVGEDGADNTLINGIMRTAPLMRIYSEMIEAGVDIATIWAAQSSTPAALSTTEGTGSDLSPTGLFLDMLAEAVEGKRMIDPSGDYKLENANGTDLGYTYSFQGETSAVTYFVSGINAQMNLNADLTRFYSDDAAVYIRVLAAADGTTGTEFWDDAQVIELGAVQMIGGAGGWTVDLTLQPYELIELYVVADGGAPPYAASDDAPVVPDPDEDPVYDDILTGTDQNDEIRAADGEDLVEGRGGDDLLYGGDGQDRLFGDAGDDVLRGDDQSDALYGGRGIDQLWGGAGDDTLRGNRDNDDLRGGDGTDRLYGGHGDDSIAGDKHKDYLYGENGHDTLNGGFGDDNLTGGDGSDTFIYRDDDYGYDRVKDFETSVDVIDLTDFNFGSFAEVMALSSDIEYGLKIKFSGGNVLLLEGLSQSQVTAEDFLI